jgi:two-component system CheB/CheR fusion protein
MSCRRRPASRPSPASLPLDADSNILHSTEQAAIDLHFAAGAPTQNRAELQAASMLKDEFLAVMAHELKHPLNLIHVNAEMLSRAPEVRDMAAVARAAEVIRRTVPRQARITDDLLDMSLKRRPRSANRSRAGG